MGLSMSDFVVTEAGFASDLGAEKFLDIKCQYGGLSPNASVIVATIRAIKYHGGMKLKELGNEDIGALMRGLENLDKHIENMRYFNLHPIVAINKFDSDTEAEIAAIISHCEKQGVRVALNEAWAKGGEGAVELAKIVVEEANKCKDCFKALYSFDSSIIDKIDTITKKMYGAAGVEYSLAARKKLEQITDLNLDNLPICIAKTQTSLSDNPALIGRPKGFIVNIRDIEIAAGAGFIVPIAGSIMRMPGLPNIPSSENIDVDDDGNITGLF
jgi:formate--tetrahydrofolate ligase